MKLYSMNNVSSKYKTLPRQIKATLWYLICTFLQKGISTITMPIFTRLLNPAEYGQFAVFNSWMGIVSIIITLNLCSGVYAQGMVKFSDERNKYSSSLQGLTFMLVTIWTVLYVITHNFWNHIFSLTTVQMMAMLVMIWTNAVFGFWAGEQRIRLTYIKLVVVTVLISLLKPIVGIIFVINSEDKVTARIVGLVLVELIGYSWMFVYQMKRGKKFFDKQVWIYALKFNLPLLPHYLSQTVLNSSDRIMIESMVNTDAAGYYNLAYQISMLMTLFTTAMSQAIDPWIYQKIKDKKYSDISLIAYPLLIFIAVVSLGFIALAPEVVKIFAPSSYYDAIWVIPPIAMSVYFTFAYGLFAKFEFYYEQTGCIMIASVVAAILNILLNRVFIAQYGYYAAGYTTLICYIISTVGHYMFMNLIRKKYINNEKIYDIKKLSLITLLFIMVGFAFLLLYKHQIIRYLIVCIILVFTAIKRKYINTILKAVKIRRQ